MMQDRWMNVTSLIYNGGRIASGIALNDDSMSTASAEDNNEVLALALVAVAAYRKNKPPLDTSTFQSSVIVFGNKSTRK